MNPRAALVALALASAVAPAVAGGKDPVGRVVFARGTSLWLTDARGKGPAVEIAALPGPASDVHRIRTDAAGTVLLVQLGARWYWATLPVTGTATLVPLPCTGDNARLSPGGDCVVCASASGKATLVRLDDGKVFDRDLPGATIALAEREGKRELVWAAGGAVRAAPITNRKQVRVVAAEAPLRGLVVSPDGRRAVGTYLAPPTGQPRQDAPREQLFTFPLDGGTARRRLLRDGVVLDFSWDGQWLLLQDGGRACVVRAVGGQYKCWKGYTAVSLSTDGAFALVLGPRDGAAAPADEPTGGDDDGGGEGSGDDEADPTDEPTVALPTGPLSLFRARLPGTYTERPALVERQVDGAAAWLPLPAPPAAPAPAPAPAAPSPAAPAPAAAASAP